MLLLLFLKIFVNLSGLFFRSVESFLSILTKLFS
jgi:hypothetical protein